MSYNWDITVLVKERFFYRGPIKSWQKKKYGFLPRGMGDLIYNTLRKIIEENDKSWWAYMALQKCYLLLIMGKRWPNYMTTDNCAKNRIHFWCLVLLRKLYLRKYYPFRWQHGMTRDPWTLFYACCVHLDRIDLIRNTKPQWWLSRPKIREWRKALIGEENNYEYYMNRNTSKKEFVIILNRYRKEAYETVQNKNLT